MENWLPVVGYEGTYEVSDLGRVKRVLKGKGARSGHILKQARGKRGGHHHVSLFVNGIGRSHYVHILVLTAFVGRCPIGQECLHKNGNPSDNSINNIHWGTHKSNMEDCINHGRTKSQKLGTDRKHTKLDETKVRGVREMLKAGVSRRKTAARFGVTKGAVDSIATGESWGWLDQEQALSPF